ncbi:MAG: helix-turn-helix domain-containing protein [Methylococcaceae bacterium]
MDRFGTTHTANVGSRNDIQQNNYTHNSAHSQRQLILDWLHHAPLTTIQARKELDIMHPAARVQELREQGHNILTHWTISDTGKAKHRVACYVLLAEVRS